MELSGRNSTVDFVRGVTAISICLFHFAYGTISLTDGNFFAKALIWTPFRWHIFFLLSGFVIPGVMDKKRYAIKHAGKFLARRFVRIGPAAYVSMVLMIGLQLSCIYIKGPPYCRHSSPWI